MEYVYITHYILIHRNILIYWYYTFQFFIHERDEDHYFGGATGFFAESGREVFASIAKKQVGFFVFLLHQLMS